jgi:hypothetical protein
MEQVSREAKDKSRRERLVKTESSEVLISGE